MNEALFFEEISSWYPLVLVDTSALSHYLSSQLNENRGKDECGTKLLCNEVEIASAGFFGDFLVKKGDFFVTKMVLNEYGNTPRVYKKRVKMFGDLTGKRLVYERSIKESQKAKNKLTSLLEGAGKILELTPDEIKYYDFLTRKYRPMSDRLGLSKTDHDFLFSGIAVSRRDPSCLVSNDIAIYNLFNHVYGEERFNSDNTNFFIRRRFDGYFPAQKI